MAVQSQAVVFVTCLTLAATAFAQQRPVPPAFARRPSAPQGRSGAPLDLDPEQPMPQPFRRVSMPVFRGRGFGKAADLPRPAPQQPFQPRATLAPVGNGGGGNESGGTNRDAARDESLAAEVLRQPGRPQGPPPSQQAERGRPQEQANRIEQQDADGGVHQLQPETPFPGSTPQSGGTNRDAARDESLAAEVLRQPGRPQGPPPSQQAERGRPQEQANRIEQQDADGGVHQLQPETPFPGSTPQLSVTADSADRIYQQQVDRVQQPQFDRVQQQPDTPFRPQLSVADRAERIQQQQVDSVQQQPAKPFRPQLSLADRAERIQQQQVDRVLQQPETPFRHQLSVADRADRIQQQQVDSVQQQPAKPFRPQLSLADRAERIQQQQVDRVQKQPEKPFTSFRPQPQILEPSVEPQPRVVLQRRVVQKPWQKRVQSTEEIAVESVTPVTVQRSKLERTESVAKQRAEQRAKKPVSQVLKKYRDDGADGSITWGFENDDGTFKEETIGADCVTRGKYGYVDPEGVKREYSYTSGIPCGGKGQQTAGPEAQASDAAHGYIDYANNRYVMADGQTVDLNGMAKNRARRPSAQAKRKAAPQQ